MHKQLCFYFSTFVLWPFSHKFDYSKKVFNESGIIAIYGRRALCTVLRLISFCCWKWDTGGKSVHLWHYALQLCLSLLECHIRIFNCQHASSIAESNSCNLRQQNCESRDAHTSGFAFLKISDLCLYNNCIAPEKAFQQGYNPPHRLPPPPAFFLKYEPLLKADTFLTLFQMIMSSQPCKRRYFISLVLDGQFQNNSCWMWYWAALPFTPKEKLGMSCPVLRGWNSWIAVSTL